MKFEKTRMAGETKSIWPPGQEMVKGRWVPNIGLVIKFLGTPPTCDTEDYARERAKWEQQVGKLPQGDKKALEQRVKELDSIIIDFIQTHKEYRGGFIIPQKTKRQRLIDQNQMVCPDCGDEWDVFVAGDAKEFSEHIRECTKPKVGRPLGSDNKNLSLDEIKERYGSDESRAGN